MNEEVMEQVREKIARELFQLTHPFEELIEDKYYPKWKNDVDPILSIPVEGKTIKELIEGWTNGKLRELDPDQSLPNLKHWDEEDARKGIASLELDIEMQARSSMLKDNWVKVLAKEANK